MYRDSSADLARNSDEVVLADYDLASMQQGRDELASSALRKRVRVLPCDLSGEVSAHLNRLIKQQHWNKLAQQNAQSVFDAAADCLEQCDVPDPPEIEGLYSGEFGVVKVPLFSHNSSATPYWICLTIFSTLYQRIWVGRNVIGTIRMQHKTFAYVSFEDTYTFYENCWMLVG